MSSVHGCDASARFAKEASDTLGQPLYAPDSNNADEIRRCGVRYSIEDGDQKPWETVGWIPASS